MSDYDLCPWYDCDPVDVWSESVHTAAKAYSCDECTGPIHKGERYQRISSLSEGYWTVHRSCHLCLDGPVAYFERNCGAASGRVIGASGWMLAHFETVFREYAFTTPGAKMRVGRMIVGLRRRGCTPVEWY